MRYTVKSASKSRKECRDLKPAELFTWVHTDALTNHFNGLCMIVHKSDKNSVVALGYVYLTGDYAGKAFFSYCVGEVDCYTETRPLEVELSRGE